MRLIITAFFFLFNYMPSFAQGAYWQQQADYKMDVTFNEKDHSLDGYASINYSNHSPDTLYYIWFHLWPNAYKNDRTAMSDQMLENGNSSFYFSDNEKRGYINRLNFKVNGAVVKVEDHPQHQDIIKIVLTYPLVPGASCKIETPFHVKLPYNFSRAGYSDNAVQATQWYPKPAVYDRKGWHPMPYLNQGEFYSEFGNYQVQITVPENYTVAATGETVDKAQKINNKNKTKTILYTQQDVHDFAWFADKRFKLLSDTLSLPSGKIISAAAYNIKGDVHEAAWKNAVKLIKKAVLFRSSLLGEYPYKTVTIIQADADYADGMEYPTITAISGVQTENELEELLEHEVGHNWNYGILANNERLHGWMDEGINTYYDTRYWNEERDINVRDSIKSSFLRKRMPENMNFLGLYNAIAEKKDQPIATSSEKFSALNYNAMVYHKASKWLKYMEQTLGRPVFDSAMQVYFQRWKFRHPYPEDLKAVMEEVSGKNLDNDFLLLHKKGYLPNHNSKRELKFASFFSFKNTDRYKYIFAGPASGYNIYDKLMLGVAIHNYTLPEERFQFFAAPLYGTGSRQMNGIGRVNYHWFTSGMFHKVEAGFNASRFSSNHSLDTNGKKIFEKFYKLVPYLKFYLTQDARSTKQRWIDIRTYIIGEKNFDNIDYIEGSDSLYRYPRGFASSTRYINQLTLNIEDNRVLYPYSGQLQLQQGKGFYRINFTGNYFFNYSKGGGVAARIFAAKFGKIAAGEEAYLYQPKLLGGNGFDDYTNSNYFMGRTALSSYSEIPLKNSGLAAQQLMIQNGGGLKFRLDPYSSVQGQSDDWVAAINLSTTVPKKLFPIPVPLKIFFDAGTYAEAWKNNSGAPKLLFTSGLQFSLFKDVLNVYLPILYSSAFKEQLKTDAEASKFFKKISFSIDLQDIRLKKLIPQLVF